MLTPCILFLYFFENVILFRALVMSCSRPQMTFSRMPPGLAMLIDWFNILVLTEKTGKIIQMFIQLPQRINPQDLSGPLTFQTQQTGQSFHCHTPYSHYYMTTVTTPHVLFPDLVTACF